MTQMIDRTEAAEAVALELLTTAEGRSDPYPRYHRLRDLAPVHHSPTFGWLLTRYEDCQAILRDPRVERGWGPTMDAFYPGWRERPAFRATDDWLVMKDGAEHTRLRRLVTRAFTPRTVERLRPRIEAMVDKLLEPLAAAGGGDLLDAIAFPLPVQVIADLLGVPQADTDPFRVQTQRMVRVFELGAPPEILDDADAAWLEIEAYFAELITAKQAAPGDDLISDLLRVDNDGDRLSDAEVISLASLLFVAGFETTTNLIGNGMLGLLAHPDQIDVLRADAALFSRMPNELLRYDGPVQLVLRMIAEDIEIDGTVLHAGRPVVVLLGAGNHDPDRFSDPDRLLFTRPEVRTLSLGGGVHYCLGAALAGIETEVVFRKLLARFSRFELVGDVPYRDTLTLRGPMALPLSLSSAPTHEARTQTVPTPLTAARPQSLRPADGDDLAWRNRYREKVEAGLQTEKDTTPIVELLDRVAFFAGCTADELVTIASTTYQIAFDPGAVICSEGAESLECYVIAEGEAIVTIGGNPEATIGPDDVVGERGAVIGTTRSATVTAATHMVTYAISRDRILSLVNQSPKARAAIEANMRSRYGEFPTA